MDEQEVKYSFTGDFRRLSESVHSVLGLLDKVSQAFRRTDESSKVDKSAKSFQDVRKSVDALRNSFSKTSKQTKDFTSKMNGLASASDLVKRALAGITGIKVGDWLSKGVKESISYIENLNLFRVAMSQSVDEGLKFVDQMSEVFGMDPSNLYRYSGYIYQLTDAIGMVDDASAVMSLSLTKAANDIASLFNIDIETVVNNIASGMQGMTRAVRKYGMDIRAVTLQQTALNYGITTQVENMSEADRMALRYLTMMEQVKNATQQVVDPTIQASGVMGDFARNIETPANQLRIFKEQISQLGRAIGNFFIPMLSKLLPILNGVTMAIRTVLTFLSAFTGFNLNFGGVSSGAADTAEAFENIGAAADGAAASAKELKKTLAPFDELNLLQAPPTPSGGGSGGASSELMDPALLEAVKNMSLSLDEIQMKANKVRDKLLEFFGFKYVEVFNPETGEFEKKLQWFADQFKQNLIDKFPQWTQTIQAIFDTWSQNVEALKNVWKSLGEVAGTVKQKIKDFIDSLHLDSTFSQEIKDLSTNLNGLSSWISEHSNSLANLVLAIGGIAGAFRLLNGIGKYLKPLVTFGAKIGSIVAPIAEVALAVGAVVAAIALLYQNSESFATSFQNLFGAIVGSLEPIAQSASTLFTRLWESVQSLWSEHLQPMVQAIGDAIAPILNTLAVLWNTLSTLFQSVMDMLGNIWENTLSPVLGAIADAISSIVSIIQTLWEEVLGPVIEHILESLPDLFESTIQPVIEKIVDIIGGMIEIILALWTNILAPLVNWFIEVFGPSIRNIFNTVWNIVSAVIKNIGKTIEGLITVIKGVIDIIAGVLTGDWKRAWEGMKEIFSGVINAIVGVFELGINGIIAGINAVISLVWGAVQSFVNGILNTINSLGKYIGLDLSLSWGTPPPAIGYVNLPKVELATGGVVTGPTNALIGEGRYDEAVIPLGNSPQMHELIDSIADRINGPEQTSLLREQNQLLRQLLETSGESVGIRDLSKAVTRIQRQELRMGGA